MYDTSATWTLTAADGTSVTFNDGGGWWLEEVTGFDSPNVRQNIEDLPEQDGATAGSSFYGSRPVTLRGKGVFATAAARNVAAVSLQRALRGLRSSVTLASTPSGLSAMQATARLENFRLTGGFVKEFLISMVCADPLNYSQAEHTTSGSGMVATTGAAFPLVFPIDFGGGTGSTVTVTVTNSGNFDAPAVIRVTGPVTNPRIENATADGSIYLDNLDLAAAAWVEIDTGERTAVLNDGTSIYHKVRFPGTAWWQLAAGANTVNLWATSASTATLAVTYRDAWA